MSTPKLADELGSWDTLLTTWKDGQLSRFALKDLSDASLVGEFLSSAIPADLPPSKCSGLSAVLFVRVVFAGLLLEVDGSCSYTFTDASTSREVRGFFWADVSDGSCRVLRDASNGLVSVRSTRF